MEGEGRRWRKKRIHWQVGELSDEHRLFDLKKDELRKLEHKRDHALSALQITKKKVIFAGKLDNMPIMRHSTTLE